MCVERERGRKKSKMSGCADESCVAGVAHFQHVVSHDALRLDEDLVDHGVAMVTVHFVDAVLVEFGQRQEHPQGKSLGPLAVAQLHRLEQRGRGRQGCTVSCVSRQCGFSFSFSQMKKETKSIKKNFTSKVAFNFDLQRQR